MKTTFFLGCLVGGIGAAIAPLLFSFSRADTKLLPFQGRLTGADGTPIPDGAKIVEFKMYDSPIGGTVTWAGEVHKLSVNGGLVNTILGSKASLGTVDFSNPCFLQITIDAGTDGQITAADPPLLPRQSVIPSPFANEAQTARKLGGYDWSAIMEGGSNNPDTSSLAEHKLPPGISVPIGGVIMWWGNKADIPAGFELCDGATPAAGSTFTSAKPDLRDRFVRGAPEATGDVAAVPATGGHDGLSLAHAHSMAHTHPMAHTHTEGNLVAQMIGPGGVAGSESIWYNAASAPQWTSDRQIYVSGAVSLSEDTGANALSNPTVGVEVVGTTAGSSAASTGASSATSTSTALGLVDNRPAFLEMFFIIRVK